MDIVATFAEKPGVACIDVNEYDDITDHFLVDFLLTCSPEVREVKEIRYRNLNGIDAGSFSAELSERWGGVDYQKSFGDNICRYTDLMKEMMDSRAPEKTKSVKIVPNAPWFDHEYANLRKQRRKAEKTFKKSKLTTDHALFVNLRK